ncbi:MAG: DUF763 domain-containing protein, partial [Myxococcota bacterium]
DPHAGIDGTPQGRIINLADRRASSARQEMVQLVERSPGESLALFREAARAEPAQGLLPHLIMPDHHDVRPENVVERRLHGALAAAAEAAPQDFESLLAVPGVGARTLASLALISEVIHGAPSRFTDPARFALAHGGKDGHPFPVPLKVYDAALSVYRQAIERAKLGRDEKLEALRRLGLQAQRLEAWAEGRFVGVDAYIEQERRDSWKYGGMTVNGPARPPSSEKSRKAAKPKRRAPPRRRRQLSLPGL